MLTLDQLISEADALTDAGISKVLVWKSNALTLYDLRSDHPQIINGSQLFPQPDLTLLTQHINPHNQPQSVKDFLNAIRQVCPPKPTT